MAGRSPPPEDFEGYRELRRRFPDLPIALGNFEVGPSGFKRLIDEGIADILQPDVTWVGGLTPTLRICEWAAEAGLEVVLHRGGEVWGLHLLVTLARPLAEFVLDNGGEVWVDPPLRGVSDIENGQIAPPGSPGFGVTLEPSITWETSDVR